MGWLSDWFWGTARELRPETAADRRQPIPVVVWDGEWTDHTQPKAFAPPRATPPKRPRVKPVVVRVTAQEWRDLVRDQQPGQDLGDVVRTWAGLPPIKR